MTHPIHATITASLSEVRQDPLRALAAGDGGAVAVLNQDAPAFYMIPAEAFEALLERLEDAELNRLADARASQPVIPVGLDDL